MSASNQPWWMQSKNDMIVLCNGNNDQLTEILLHEKITSKHAQQASDAAEHTSPRIPGQSKPAEVEAVAENTNGSPRLPTLYEANLTYNSSGSLHMEGVGVLRCHRCKRVIGGTSSMPTDQPPMWSSPNDNRVEGDHMTPHLNLIARNAEGMEETGIDLLGNAEDLKTGKHFEDWHGTI